MCTDLPARMFWERPNGAQRRSVGHADLPSCEHDRPNPLLRATSLLIRQELKTCKKAISLPSCSLPLKILVRLKFLVKYSILAPTTQGAAGLKYGFLFSTCWPVLDQALTLHQGGPGPAAPQRRPGGGEAGN